MQCSRSGEGTGLQDESKHGEGFKDILKGVCLPLSALTLFIISLPSDCESSLTSDESVRHPQTAVIEGCIGY